MEKILAFAKELIEKHIDNNSICVDCTCGKGNDTLFLAQKVKMVYAFDIQEKAINETKTKLIGFNNVIYINDSHENINKYVKEEIKAVMFNLGYLPTGDKLLTTKAITTVKAIKKALTLLQNKGIITIVCYPGHEEGAKEAKKVTKFCQELNQKEFDVIKYDFINQINNPPFLIAIEKI